MEHKNLKKELGLWDVYAIATGAMFSSGFFLLPGLAAAQTGPSVFLAYFVSGLIVLPTMFSMAELTTALPKAGGTYYIIDRSLGPIWGTIGGYGSWLALVLKSAFALIGMGAYLSIFIELPITCRSCCSDHHFRHPECGRSKRNHHAAKNSGGGPYFYHDLLYSARALCRLLCRFF